MATSTLADIQKKVRLLTRSASEQLLSTSDLNQYINTFILYDFPQIVRLFNLRSTFTFYTQPNVDVYSTQTTDNTNALFDFANKIVAVHPQIYIAGVPVFYTQLRDEFYGTYPIYNQILNQVAIADGTVGPFAGNINAAPNPNQTPISNQSPILQNNVIFSTITTDNTAMTLVDYPQNGQFGYLGYQNIAATPLANFGEINYLTGDFAVTFPANTILGNVISAEVVPYQAGMPTAILYYDQEFTVRPVPDKAYSVQMQVDILPTQLLLSGDNPNVNQWWQFYAYGAALKVLQDRADIDTVQLHYPEFERQRGMVLSSTATTLANERSKTIYTQDSGRGLGFGYGAVGWPF